MCAVCLVAQSRLTLCDPIDYSLPGSSVHGDSSGKNNGVGYHALLQGIFPIQGLNPGLSHCRQTLPSEPPGKTKNTGVGSQSLLQGNFLIQESLALQADSLLAELPGKPIPSYHTVYKSIIIPKLKLF